MHAEYSSLQLTNRAMVRPEEGQIRGCASAADRRDLI